jgi:hypothetical protein
MAQGDDKGDRRVGRRSARTAETHPTNGFNNSEQRKRITQQHRWHSVCVCVCVCVGVCIGEHSTLSGGQRRTDEFSASHCRDVSFLETKRATRLSEHGRSGTRAIHQVWVDINAQEMRVHLPGYIHNDTYICTYARIHIHIATSTHPHIHTFTHPYWRIHTHERTHERTHTYAWTDIHTHSYPCAHSTYPHVNTISQAQGAPCTASTTRTDIHHCQKDQRMIRTTYLQQPNGLAQTSPSHRCSLDLECEPPSSWARTSHRKRTLPAQFSWRPSPPVRRRAHGHLPVSRHHLPLECWPPRGTVSGRAPARCLPPGRQWAEWMGWMQTDFPWPRVELARRGRAAGKCWAPRAGSTHAVALD